MIDQGCREPARGLPATHPSLVFRDLPVRLLLGFRNPLACPSVEGVMRTARTLAIAVLITAVAGCASDRAGAPSSAPPAASPGAAAPASPDTAPAASTFPAPAASPGAPPPATTGRGEVPVTPPSAGDDRRGDLVRGVRSLRGVIEREGEWVILRTGGGRWALLGDRARTLTAGQEVQVRGRPTTPPVGCPTDRALNVTR